MTAMTHEQRLPGGATRCRWLSAGVLALVAAVAFVPAVIAHTSGGARDVGSLWHWDPLVLAALLLGGWLNGRGVSYIWRRAGAGRGVPRWQVLAFAAGLAVLAVALISPLAGLAAELFSAHMAQHLLLILAAPPLLLLAAPHVVGAVALPRAWRRPLAVAIERVRRHPLLLALSALAPLWLIQLAGLWIWHLPRYYEAALRSEPLHALEHATLLGTAFLFWGVALRPFGPSRRGYAAAIVFVIATALPNAMLGALITLAPSAWYATYAGTVSAWGMTPLSDQQIAGLLMWIPPGLVYVALVAALLHGWLERPGPTRTAFGSLPPVPAFERQPLLKPAAAREDRGGD